MDQGRKQKSLFQWLAQSAYQATLKWLPLVSIITCIPPLSLAAPLIYRSATDCCGRTIQQELSLIIDFREQIVPALNVAENSSNEGNKLFQEGLQLHREGTAVSWRQAIQKWEEALKLWQEMGDSESVVLALTWLGKVHSDLGEYSQALNYYNQLLPLSREISDRYSEASSLIAIANIHLFLGEYQQAINSYNQALSIWQIVDLATGQAQALNNIGLVYSDLGEYQEALNHFNRALPLVQKAGDRAGEAYILNNIGKVQAEKGRFTEALDTYKKALSLWQQVDNPSGVASTLNNIGFVHAKLGSLSQALSAYNKALPLWEKVGDRRGIASTLNNIGFVYANFGMSSKALDYYNRALPIRQEIGDRPKVALTLYSIASALRDQGKLKEAQTQIETALEIIEDLRTNVAAQELRASFFASKQDYYELYIDLLMQLHKQYPSEGYDAKALSASERTRARSLLEILTEANADIRSGVDPQLLEQERQLQQQLNAIEKRRIEILSRQPTQEQVALINKEFEDTLTQYRQVQRQIRVTSPRYAALTQPQPLTLPEIQQQVLDRDTLLLEYFLGEKRSYLWVVTPTSMTSYELPPKDQIEKAARKFRNTLTDPVVRERRGVVSEAAGELSELILAPLADLLQEKRLLIVTDGALQYIPFATLTDPKTLAEGENSLPLVVKHEIVSLPSASTIGILREELAGRNPAPKTLAVFADPVFGANDERFKTTEVVAPNLSPNSEELDRAASSLYKRLPFTEEEALQIVALVPSSERTTAFGFDANLARATSQELSQYRIIHFATHGIADSTHPELSRLVLSLVDKTGQPLNGFLRLHDIFNLNLPAELVVLSACQTGLGQEIRGEGVVGLARGFMYAGAARLVVSLWSVDDKGTAELMVKFYREMLQNGLTPAAALRAAQIQMSQDEKWKAPYFWAGFILQGEWREE